MPNLEHLRKQAKLYLRWHRAGYHPVAAQIRSVLARYHGLTDMQVLAMDFKLSDAQELVARQSGVESWPALKKGLESMTTSATASIATSTLLAAEPQLFVSSMEAACDFYTRKLGFQVAFSHGEPPFYAQVVRDGVRMNLRHVDGPVFDGQFRATEQDALSTTIRLDDAKPLFLEYQAASVTFHQALRTEPWGARTFIVQDPDGNLIAFAGAAS